MKPIHVLSALIIICILVSCKPNNEKTDLYRKIPSYELKSDFNNLLERISAINPDPYNNCSRPHVDSLATEIKNKLTDSMTVLQYYRLVRPFVSAFNDGHFSMFLPDAYENDFKTKGGKLLPFNVAIDGKRIFISQSFTADTTIKTGREITAVNGISSDKLIDDMLNFISGDSGPYKMQSLEERFQILLWRVYGFDNNFDITFKNGMHKIITGVLAQKLNIDSAAKQDFNFTLIKVKQQPIGLIKISLMETEKKEAFDKFLQTTFAAIQQQQVKTLIIDIRDNGGGSTKLVSALYNYITTKPYSFGISESYFSNGKLKTDADTTLTIPAAVKNKFSGKVFLLSNSGTYSTAHMMANSFKYYKLGVIVGDSSAEKMRISGEVTTLTLPNTGLTVYCPSSVFALPNSTGANSRLHPDYQIIPTLNDKLYKKDTVLSYCINLISRSNN